MTKRLFFVLGIIVGFLFAEILRRQQMERLAEFEAKAARSKAQHAQFEREWQAEMATRPFEERMDYELWEAGMRLNNWMPPEDWEEDDDEPET